MIDIERIPPDKLVWWLAGWEDGFLAGANAEQAERLEMFTPEAIEVVKRAAAMDPHQVRTRIECPGHTPEQIRDRVRTSWMALDPEWTSLEQDPAASNSDGAEAAA